MLSAVYSVPRVIGGDLMLFIWVAYSLVYLICGMFRRQNRGRRGR